MPTSVRQDPPAGPIDWCFSLAAALPNGERVRSITPWDDDVVIVTDAAVYLGRLGADGHATVFRVHHR